MAYFVCIWTAFNVYTGADGVYDMGFNTYGNSGQYGFVGSFYARCTESGSDVISMSDPEMVDFMDGLSEEDQFCFRRVESPTPAPGFSFIDYAGQVAAWKATH